MTGPNRGGARRPAWWRTGGSDALSLPVPAGRPRPPTVPRMRRALPLLVLVLALVPASGAQAATYRDLQRECVRTNAVSNPLAWTRSQYEQAIAKLPADAAEYTQCVSILQRAELAITAAAARGGGGSGGSGGSGGRIGPIGGGGGGPQNPAERAALQGAISDRYVPPRGSGGGLSPLVRLEALSVRHPLPSSLTALLVLLAAGTVLAAVPSLLRRVRLRRQR